MNRSYRALETMIQQWIWQQEQELDPHKETMEPNRFSTMDIQNPEITWYNLRLLSIASPMN